MKKNNRFVFLMLLAITALSATSCLKDTDGEKREEEKRLIDNYLSVNNITVTPTTNGLYYIEQLQGTGASPVYGDFALIKFNGYDINGELFNTTDKALAEQKKITPSFAIGGPYKIYMNGNYYLPGVLEGLTKMKEGGKAKMIMPSLLAYNDYVPRIFDVELVKVISNPMAYEREQIANFLDTASTLEVKDSTAAGLYYIEKLTGTADKFPALGNTVKLKYKGYFPDGRVFDTNYDATDSLTFKIGDLSVIKGMDEGIRLMKKMGKGTLVIPYYRGYGFDQLRSKNQVVIPYFSTLIFDIELLDIK